MELFRKHELFEIEVLEKMKSGRFLEPLVFGGGTMLRLCYDLNRYSTDLDFWFIKKVNPKEYFKKLKKYLETFYELTDAHIKFYTILLELRSGEYPKRLKIEIRKQMKACDFQEKIAFSQYSTKQVILKVHTLEQTMMNKIEAALERRDIRDCFDLEFLSRQGIPIVADDKKLHNLKKLILSFKDYAYKVTLGSVLAPDARKYYRANRLDYLFRKINEQLAELK
jgi:predicted nucleotidyltransferase component of viral defense system